MTNASTLAIRWTIACCATLPLLGITGCQRQEPATADAAGAPVQATPAPAPIPAPATTAASDEPPAGALRAYVWDCADGQKLVMRNLFRERAVAIDFHDGTRRLDQTLSASGVRYADAGTVFWTKGSAATLERQGLPAVQCSERRAASLREDARARGVTLRALGNEPGWVLEIGPAGRLGWTTNFGELHYDFEQSQRTDVDGTVTFVAQQGANSIKATVRAERCIGDGGVEYDHVATVEFEGQSHRGCGTRLNAD